MKELPVYIITGGIGAGKSKLTGRLESVGFLAASPADILKRTLAHIIAKEMGADESVLPFSTPVFPDNSDNYVYTDGTELLPYEEGPSVSYAQELFTDMNKSSTKPIYRELLQAFGEYFSNQDGFHWIKRAVNEVEHRITDYKMRGVHPTGIAFDSIRRKEEIIGIKNVYPHAKIVRLEISLSRQTDYLHNLGNSQEQIDRILGHKSEHWLDSVAHHSDFKPDFIINADYGDDYIWDELRKEDWELQQIDREGRLIGAG